MLNDHNISDLIIIKAFREKETNRFYFESVPFQTILFQSIHILVHVKYLNSTNLTAGLCSIDDYTITYIHFVITYLYRNLCPHR